MLEAVDQLSAAFMLHAGAVGRTELQRNCSSSSHWMWEMAHTHPYRVSASSITCNAIRVCF